MPPETPEEFRLEAVKDAVKRVEIDAKDFEEKLERKFNDYVLTLVFNNYKEYVDQRMKPIEKIVYGLVALVLVAVIGALLGLVIISNGP